MNALLDFGLCRCQRERLRRHGEKLPLSPLNISIEIHRLCLKNGKKNNTRTKKLKSFLHLCTDEWVSVCVCLCVCVWSTCKNDAKRQGMRVVFIQVSTSCCCECVFLCIHVCVCMRYAIHTNRASKRNKISIQLRKSFFKICQATNK